MWRAVAGRAPVFLCSNFIARSMSRISAIIKSPRLYPILIIALSKIERSQSWLNFAHFSTAKKRVLIFLGLDGITNFYVRNFFATIARERKKNGP